MRSAEASGEPGPEAGIDPLARAAAVGVAAARIGIGIGAFAFTRPALSAIGAREPGTAAIALARIAGGRDIALGLLTLAASGDRERLREASAIGALVDAGDALAFGAAIGGQREDRGFALRNAPVAAAAALVGGWILSRL